MSDGKDNVIQMPPVMELIHPDPEALIAKRHDFPATAALVEELKPFYDQSLHTIDGSAKEKRHTDVVGTNSRFPEALAKEVRTHLGELQNAAFTFEAHGDMKRAEEVRGVAQNLAGMLKIVQQFSKPLPIKTPTGQHVS